MHTEFIAREANTYSYPGVHRERRWGQDVEGGAGRLCKKAKAALWWGMTERESKRVELRVEFSGPARGNKLYLFRCHDNQHPLETGNGEIKRSANAQITTS